MKLLYAFFFGASIAGIAYSKLGRRVGYTNTQNVWMLTGVFFVIATIVFYTILATLGL